MHAHITILQMKIQTVTSTPEVFLMPLPSHYPSGSNCYYFYYPRGALPVSAPRGLIQYVLFCVWLLVFSVMSVRFTYPLDILLFHACVSGHACSFLPGSFLFLQCAPPWPGQSAQVLQTHITPPSFGKPSLVSSQFESQPLHLWAVWLLSSVTNHLFMPHFDWRS